MKIAVSLPDELFERADELAARLGVSRSQVYAQALDAYVQEHGRDPVTATLDELADELAGVSGPVADGAAARRLIDAGHWEW